MTKRVVWGCAIHQTPAGQVCVGCISQGELFSRSEVKHSYRASGANGGRSETK